MYFNLGRYYKKENINENQDPFLDLQRYLSSQSENMSSQLS